MMPTPFGNPREKISMKASRSAISKSRAILIAALIIGALAEAGAYWYVENFTAFASSSSSALTSFQLGNMTINPSEATVGQQVDISVGAVNVGDTKGSYSLKLDINGSVVETKDLTLAANESQIVTFNVNETVEGSYNVTVGDQSGIFSVSSKPNPLPAELKVSNIRVIPIEVWAGDPVNITFNVKNTGTEDLSYRLPVMMNGAKASSVEVDLASGATQSFVVTLSGNDLGSYPIVIGGVGGNSFHVVPTGKHTLHLIASRPGISFTLDGQSYNAPVSFLLDVGPHDVAFASSYILPTASYGKVAFTFVNYNDGTTNPTKTLNLQKETYLIATYTRPGSCPSLYSWNGTEYTYVAEVSDGPGWLGYLDHFQPDGTMVFSYNYPWDYVKVAPSQLQAKDGFYTMNIMETSDEIYYLDAAKLVAIDHPSNVNVFSTAGTYIYNLANQGTFYTVSKNPSVPISAVNGSGSNVLPQLSIMDGVFTSGTRWQWNNITLNLGKLAGSKEIKLVVAATINWPSTSAGGTNFLKYKSLPGVTPSPPPFIEVKAANGSWVRVPDDRQFPLPDVTDEVFVVNMTGLFATNDYSIRINTYQDIRFDYIGVDTTQQQSLNVQSILPSSADLQQAFTFNSNASGGFTKYGDVTALVLSANDQFVIGRIGDGVQLKFPANLPLVAAGMERDYFLVASVWFKGNGLSYVPFTVNPMPFQAMTSFPYPPNQTYPYDATHLYYLQEYNIRVFS
jgi:hypothetical protein